MTSDLEVGLYIFMLAGFLGYHIITRVPPLLHTPLMSATNAIAAISLVGSLVVAGGDYSNIPNGWVCTLLGFIAVTCSATNAFGGFLITDRMLRMFKTAEERASGRRRPVELQAFGFVLALVGAVAACSMRRSRRHGDGSTSASTSPSSAAATSSRRRCSCSA
jgi:NAD(P) transhydrogenase subunit alpha